MSFTYEGARGAGRSTVPSKSELGGGRSLNPNRVSIWPVERGGYGIDFFYHGATGYADGETAERMLQAAGLTTSFRQELDSA